MADIKLKKSSVTGKVPLGTDLDYGELAINYADGKLYYKNSSNAIKVFSDSDNVQTQINNSLAGVGGGGGVDILDDSDTNATRYLTFTDQTSGSEDTLTITSTKLYFNPFTGQLNATDFNSLSDEKFKTNVETIENSIEKIEAIRGVTFDWVQTGKKSMGVIAQEIEKVLPDVVSGTDSKTVNYSAIIGLLIETVKDLNKRINELEKK